MQAEGEFVNEAGEVLARFSAIAHEISPEFATRMMDEVERQAEHEREMDRAASRRADVHTDIHDRVAGVDIEMAPALIRHANRGQFMAYSIALMIIALGFYVVAQGQAAVAAAIITAGVALAGVVFWKRDSAPAAPNHDDPGSAKQE